MNFETVRNQVDIEWARPCDAYHERDRIRRRSWVSDIHRERNHLVPVCPWKYWEYHIIVCFRPCPSYVRSKLTAQKQYDFPSRR